MCVYENDSRSPFRSGAKHERVGSIAGIPGTFSVGTAFDIDVAVYGRNP